VKVFSDVKTVGAFGTYRVDGGSFPYYQVTNYLQPPTVALAYLLGIYLVGGQNMAVRRKEALQIGGFDENLAMLEDADMIKRMAKVGKIAFLADNIVLSSGRRTNEGWRYFLRAGWADVEFFLFGKKKFKKFPDYR
jgi:GT2 family glycosyltransferase